MTESYFFKLFNTIELFELCFFQFSVFPSAPVNFFKFYLCKYSQSWHKHFAHDILRSYLAKFHLTKLLESREILLF